MSRSSIEQRVIDLEDGQSAKQDTLVSGTNIKTINGNSLLGSGNLSVGGGSFSGTMDDIPDGTTYVKTENNLTDAEKTVLSNTSGTNTGDETTSSIKTKLGITTLSGSNTGDQTSIVGISGTKAQFDTACSDGDFLYVGDVTQYTDENAQDAIGGMAANSTFVNLTYSDATPSLTPSLSATGTPSSTTFLRGDNTWAAPTDPAGWTTIVKSANQDVTNSSSLTNDTDLTFSVVAGGHYMVMCDLVVSGSNTTADYTGGFVVSAGTMVGKGTHQSISATAAVQNIVVNAATSAGTTSIVTGAATANIDDLVYVRMAFAFTASSNATFSYRFANAVATAGAISRTWKGSIMRYKRLD